MTGVQTCALPISQRPDTERLLGELAHEHEDEPLYPYLLGNLAQREKETGRAIRHYEEALEADPHHIESTRQLRILRMRQRSNEHSGLFDIFKKR